MQGHLDARFEGSVEGAHPVAGQQQDARIILERAEEDCRPLDIIILRS